MKPFLLILLIYSIITGCKNPPPCALLPENNETMLLMMEAGLYFTILKNSGMLDEIDKDDRGKLQTMPVLEPSQIATYPFLTRLGVVLDGKDVVYWYLIRREKQSSDWDVVKIWKTNKDNIVLAESIPLPDTPAQTEANIELRERMTELKDF